MQKEGAVFTRPLFIFKLELILEIHAKLETEVTWLLVADWRTIVTAWTTIALRSEFPKIRDTLLIEHVKYIDAETCIKSIRRNLERGGHVREHRPVRLQLATARGDAERGARCAIAKAAEVWIGDDRSICVHVTIESSRTISTRKGVYANWHTADTTKATW